LKKKVGESKIKLCVRHIRNKNTGGIMKKTFLLAFLLILAFSSDSFALEFSADTVTTVKGGEKMTGTINFKPDKFRMEMKDFGKSIMITRLDKHVAWNIMPERKMYMEMPIDMKNKPRVDEKFEGEIERKEVGREKIDGHPTIKYLITYRVDKEKSQVYQWLATDINFPIRTAAVDGSWTQEFRNIRKGSQPDSLFELPKGYQKMELPKIPGMKFN
jgi:hypothetical protein